MLTLDLSEAAALSWALSPLARAGSEPSHAGSHTLVSLHAFFTLNFDFFSVLHSSFTGSTRRTLQQPTSFAEDPYGWLPAGLLARSPSHMGCKGWLQRGQPGHRPLPCPVSGHAGEAEAIPASDTVDATCLSDTSPQTASTLLPPSIMLCWMRVSCSPSLNQGEGQAKPASPYPSSAAGTEMLRFRLCYSSCCSAEEASTQKASPPRNRENKDFFC